jgi:hypothetical protein
MESEIFLDDEWIGTFDIQEVQAGQKITIADKRGMRPGLLPIYVNAAVKETKVYADLPLYRQEVLLVREP